MKVLITGCSSSQLTDERIPTFSGLLYKTIKKITDDVVWSTPSMRWDEEYLKNFDVVLVGLTPPTSLSAYHIYGALHTIDVAKKVTNVKYIVDAPEPHRLWNGIRAIASNPDDLVKEFYSSRPNYRLAIEPERLKNFQSVINSLYNDSWEDTIIPAFPWSEKNYITKYIPNLSDESTYLLCLDSIIFSDKDNSLFMKSNSDFWSYDSETKWLKDIKNTIVNRVEPITTSKKPLNNDILIKINRSIGSLISVYKNNDPWWSVNLSQSLLVNTPVSTEWRYTNNLGSSWSYLPHQIEELTHSERSMLASRQREQYIKSIPNITDAINSVSSLLSK